MFGWSNPENKHICIISFLLFSKFLGFIFESHTKFSKNYTYLTHFKSVSGKSVIMAVFNSNWLFLHVAPCNFNPVTPKQLSFWLPPPPSVIVTSSASSSSDQLFACATHWRVAVMYASGFKRPPNQTGNPWFSKKKSKEKCSKKLVTFSINRSFDAMKKKTQITYLQLFGSGLWNQFRNLL